VCEGLKVKIKIKIKIKKFKEAHSTTFVSTSVFPQLFISLLLKKKNHNWVYQMDVQKKGELKFFYLFIY